MGKTKKGGGKTINTINVSFDNTEWEALQKTKGEQSWREFIMNSAKSRVLELYDTQNINRFSMAFDVTNEFVFTFDVFEQIDLKTIVIKVPGTKEGEE